jgi:hypothetical protein
MARSSVAPANPAEERFLPLQREHYGGLPDCRDPPQKYRFHSSVHSLKLATALDSVSDRQRSDVTRESPLNIRSMAAQTRVHPFETVSGDTRRHIGLIHQVLTRHRIRRWRGLVSNIAKTLNSGNLTSKLATQALPGLTFVTSNPSERNCFAISQNIPKPRASRKSPRRSLFWDELGIVNRNLLLICSDPAALARVGKIKVTILCQSFGGQRS